MMVSEIDILPLEKKLQDEKAFCEAYIELCNKFQLDFNYDEAGALSIDRIPDNEDFMSIKAFAEFMLEELNNNEQPLVES